MTYCNKRKNTLRTVLLCVIIALSIFFTKYSENISAFAKDALRLCAMSVIPSLFPFMVLSSLASKTASHLTGKHSEKTAVILSVFLGALCGFPVGAATVASMYKNGALPKKKAEYICAFCNNTGPAFVIGVIGINFWQNRKLGIIFYICQLLAAAIVFVICRLIFRKRISGLSHIDSRHASASVDLPETRSSANAFDTFANAFCASVTESAIAVIQICGYIVFFMVICETFRLFLPRGNTSKNIFTLISAILEFTTGTHSAAALGGICGIFLCGFSIGFSGLSVMAQSVSILSKAGLSSSPMLFLKPVIGIVSALLSAIAYIILDLPYTVAVGAVNMRSLTPFVISAGIIGTACILYLFLRLRSFINNR